MAVSPPPITPKTKSRLSSLILMISVATILGLIAAVGIWQYLTQTQKQVQQLTITKAVVVASKDIPAGTQLTQDYLTIKEFPAKAIPEDYPSTIDAVLNRTVKSSLKQGEIITEPRLVAQGAEGGLPMVIPDGYRAHTIKVTEISGAGGYISPGDKVDILSIVERGEETVFSKTILQNVLVLAAGDSIIDINNVAEPGQKIVSQVTVALSPRDSEKVALASQVGEMKLVLRKLNDENILATTGINLEDIYGDLLPAKPLPEGYSQAVQVANNNLLDDLNSIEVILGDQKSYYYY